uniref:protein-serine/threonine phosphatase n=1 Tax=Leersia perrieri TaxID=77586 RepID=A0A0D9VFX3_9ORYZ
MGLWPPSWFVGFYLRPKQPSVRRHSSKSRTFLTREPQKTHTRTASPLHGGKNIILLNYLSNDSILLSLVVSLSSLPSLVRLLPCPFPIRRPPCILRSAARPPPHTHTHTTRPASETGADLDFAAISERYNNSIVAIHPPRRRGRRLTGGEERRGAARGAGGRIGRGCMVEAAAGRRSGTNPQTTTPRGPAPGADGRRVAAELRGIPGRIAGNGACAVASLYTQQGKKGVNQDAMIVWENFCSREDTTFCGVFDGHGPNGHLVAKRVRDLLPIKLGADLATDEGRQTSTSNIKSNGDETGSPQNMGRDAEQNGEYPEIFTALRTSFLRVFNVMDRDLKSHKNIDCFFSGTTAVAVLKQGRNLIIGNLGDSRAILGTRDKDNQLMAVQLTVDLKPNIPSEAQRIRQRRGRIFALPEEPEVARVWLPKYNSPGLAMARAFGDFCLKDYGLISTPEVSYHRITEKDEFVVLATDGVWDVLSNTEVVSIINRATSRASAARFLVESAHRAWRARFPTSKIDDCAVVCLFLDTVVMDSDDLSAVDAVAKLVTVADMSKNV